MRCIFFFVFIGLSSACVLRPVGSAELAYEAEQKALLQAQGNRLNILSESQADVLNTLASLHSQVQILNNKLSEQSKNKPDSPSVPQDLASAAIEVRDSDAPMLRGKAVLGRVEYVWLESINQFLKARIDTGALSSSLKVSSIQRFERNGERWVRFNIGFDGQEHTWEAPLLRHVRIRQSSSDEPERRPVVKLKISIGEVVEEVEFTLSKRNNILYSMVLGRNFLQDIAVVDVARKFTRKRDPALIAKAAAE